MRAVKIRTRSVAQLPSAQWPTDGLAVNTRSPTGLRLEGPREKAMISLHCTLCPRTPARPTERDLSPAKINFPEYVGGVWKEVAVAGGGDWP